LSRIYDELQRVEALRSQPELRWNPEERPFRVIAVTSNKGGVGKTTLATNLAIYLRATREDLPVLLFSLDDQDMVNRMFALEEEPAKETVASAFRAGSFTSAIRTGQYGVDYIPSSSDVVGLKREIEHPFALRRVLKNTDWRGLIIIDTKSDLEILTQNAIAASDLAAVVIKDQSSLLEAHKVYELLKQWNLPRDRARILLSLLDLRVKYEGGDYHDILGLLLAAIRRCGYPQFATFMSRSPKIESLYTNPKGGSFSVLHEAQGSLVHRQLSHLAQEVLDLVKLE